MPKLLIQIDEGKIVPVETSARIIYEFESDERTDGAESEQLHHKFTAEGLVTDAIRDDEVIATRVMDPGEIFQAMVDEEK